MAPTSVAAGAFSATFFVALSTLALLLVGGVAWMLSRRRRGRRATPDRLDTLTAWPPTPARVLTREQRLAFVTLVRALPGHIVLAQVPLARFLNVPAEHSHAEWLQRIGHHCLDLVVCDTGFRVVAVVDVQLPPHAMEVRQLRRIARAARSLDAAGIPWFVWTEGAVPSVDQARATILRRLTPHPPAPASGPVRPPAAPAPAAEPHAFADSTPDSMLDAFFEPRPAQSSWLDALDSAPVPLRTPSKGLLRNNLNI